MPPKKRSSPQGARRSHDWLRRESARSRPWAYEELLFGSNEETFEGEWLDSLAAGLAVDLAELRRMQNELHEQVVRVAALEGRVHAMRRLVDSGRLVQAEETGPEPKAPSLPSAPVSEWRSTERGYSLARSEGFRVDSPSGFVGFVEGLRFVSRIDEPDLLEVRSGRFGREPMLIPIEAVEDISPAEQRLVIRATPPPQADHLHELVARFRNVVSASVHHLVR
jgi:hypothetical protein